MSKINIREFKETVLSHVSKEDALYKYIQSKGDEIEIEEAPYFASTVINLINNSKLDSSS